jgi:poly [ADP-ribose] polymerase
MGHLSKRKSILRKQIEQLGGTIVKTIDKTTDVIISTQSYLSQQKGNKKIQIAQTFEIYIVPEEFLDDILNDRPVIVMEKLKLSAWGILPHIRKQQNHQKKKSSTSLKSTGVIGRSRKSIPEKVTMKLKDGVAVDPDSGKFRSTQLTIDDFCLFIGLEETCHVLKDNETGEIYTAVLGMVDITRGTNSYYKIQLLEDDTNKQWFLFRA